MAATAALRAMDSILKFWAIAILLPGQDGGKRMGLNFDRVKYWLPVGAQPPEPVQRITFRGGLLQPPPVVAMTPKGGPRDTRPIDPMSSRYFTSGDAESVESLEDDEDDENEAENKESLLNMIILITVLLAGWLSVKQLFGKIISVSCCDQIPFLIPIRVTVTLLSEH